MAQWQPEYQPRRTGNQNPAIPPQFGQNAPPREDPRGMPRYSPPPQETYRPPRQRDRVRPAGPQWTYQPPRRQAPPRPAPSAPRSRPLPPYPRFPRLMPRSSRRGPSVWRMVYLGTHPVALMMSAFISCLVISAWACFAMIAGLVWLAACAVVAVQRASARRR